MTSRLWDSYIRQTRESNQAFRRNQLSCAGQLGAWRRWSRETEIVALLPMVDRIARNVRWMFAPHLDLRDLVQSGAVGLVHAANSYHPAKARLGFEPYAWFVVRGAIIDSQKRKTYREELNISLQAIAEAHAGWLPPALDTDRAPLADELAERNEIHRLLAAAIEGLPALERQAMTAHLEGQSLSITAGQMGRSLAMTRATLAEARRAVGVAVRGEDFL